MSVSLHVVFPFEKSKETIARLVTFLNEGTLKTFQIDSSAKLTVRLVHPILGSREMAFDITTTALGIGATVKLQSHLVRMIWNYPAYWHNTFGLYSKNNQAERKVVQGVCRELGLLLGAKKCVHYRDCFLPEITASFDSFMKTLEKEGKVGLLKGENLEALKKSGGCDAFSSFIERW